MHSEIIILVWIAKSSLMSQEQIQWCVCVCVCVSCQLCLTLRNLMDYSLPGSDVHGILQARILELVATAFSRRSSPHRDQTESPALQADSLLSESQWYKHFIHSWTLWENMVCENLWELNLYKCFLHLGFRLD